MFEPASHTQNSLLIEPIKAFDDNYLWLLHDNTHAVVVDPGASAPVEARLAQLQLELSAILITHHHPDHTGGLPDLLKHRDIPVYGPNNPRIALINQRVGSGARVKLASLGSFEVLEVPGHTLDHIAFYSHEQAVLFCGDTLFSAGCGRLFEGSPAQMLQSLQRLASLPAATRVYCTHEYTLSNLRFAQAAEPHNSVRDSYTAWCEAQRAANLPTLPSSIGQELAINPFLRCRQPAVRAAVAAQAKVDLTSAPDDELTTFTALRQWKNNFR